MQADKLKAAGNTALKRGDVSSAVQSYSMAIRKLLADSKLIQDGIGDPDNPNRHGVKPLKRKDNRIQREQKQEKDVMSTQYITRDNKKGFQETPQPSERNSVPTIARLLSNRSLAYLR